MRKLEEIYKNERNIINKIYNENAEKTKVIIDVLRKK